MRPLMILCGFLLVVAHSVYGAIAMNDPAVAAASGVPLDTAVADMVAAGQVYSTIPGLVFAAVGCVLAVAWLILAVGPGREMSGWMLAAVWGAFMALGAPAYFLASFGNLNSVGDTYADWNAEAAWAWELPVYLLSGMAGLLMLLALGWAAVNTWRGTGRPVS